MYVYVCVHRMVYCILRLSLDAAKHVVRRYNTVLYSRNVRASCRFLAGSYGFLFTMLTPLIDKAFLVSGH
jgi:hypothetical protein